MASQTTPAREEDALIASLEKQGMREYSWGDFALKKFPLPAIADDDSKEPSPSL